VLLVFEKLTVANGSSVPDGRDDGDSEIFGKVTNVFRPELSVEMFGKAKGWSVGRDVLGFVL
jgi:hypothetical protein